MMQTSWRDYSGCQQPPPGSCPKANWFWWLAAAVGLALLFGGKKKK